MVALSVVEPAYETGFCALGSRAVAGEDMRVVLLPSLKFVVVEEVPPGVRFGFFIFLYFDG